MWRVLLLLVAAVAVGGYFNYERNAHLDEELEFRPFQGLSDEDLATLIGAHEAEIATRRIDLANAPDPGRDGGRLHPSDLAGKIQQFEKGRDRREHWKQLYRSVLDEEVELESLRKEQQLREAGLDQPWRRALRRATQL